MRLKSVRKTQKQTTIDGLTLMLILFILFELLNVVLTVNGMSPFEKLK